MSEKELLYLDDTLGHIENMQDYILDMMPNLESEDFLNVLNDLEKLNKDVYKNLYKMVKE